jgi:hypothetical protein
MFLYILEVIKVVRGIEPNQCGENSRVVPIKSQPQSRETEENDDRHPVNVCGVAIKPPVPSHTKNKSDSAEQQPERPDFSETTYGSLATINRISPTRESWRSSKSSSSPGRACE